MEGLGTVGGFVLGAVLGWFLISSLVDAIGGDESASGYFVVWTVLIIGVPFGLALHPIVGAMAAGAVLGYWAESSRVHRPLFPDARHSGDGPNPVTDSERQGETSAIPSSIGNRDRLGKRTADPSQIPTYRVTLNDETITVQDLRSLKVEGVYRRAAPDFRIGERPIWITDRQGVQNAEALEIANRIDEAIREERAQFGLVSREPPRYPAEVLTEAHLAIFWERFDRTSGDFAKDHEATRAWMDRFRLRADGWDDLSGTDKIELEAVFSTMEVTEHYLSFLGLEQDEAVDLGIELTPQELNTLAEQYRRWVQSHTT